MGLTSVGCMTRPQNGHSGGMQTNEYAPGRFVDVFGEAKRPAVLLWHGMQTDARSALAPFATLIADHGYFVIVPDWDSHAEDNGRDDLFRSLRYATAVIGSDRDFTLIGWSLGGTAAAGVAMDPQHYASPVSQVLCLAGAFGAVNPLSGENLSAADPPAGNRVRLTLLHGVADNVVPLSASEHFASTHEAWPIRVITFDADHGSIVGAIYNADADRYYAAEDLDVLSVADGVADLISEILRSGTGESAHRIG